MSVATLSIILILISAMSHALVGALMIRSDDKLVLRETSVIFGAILAALWLKENFELRRVILAIILAIGLILMHIA